MGRPPYEEAAALAEALKQSRLTAQMAKQEQRRIEALLMRLELSLDPAEDQQGFPFISGWKLLLDTLQRMESDDEYRYETVSPRYDGQNFIATTANINEFQARRFGPVPHEDMRRMFMEFVRYLEAEGVDFVYYRTTMRYNYEQGDDASTGFRIEVPVAYLKGRGADE